MKPPRENVQAVEWKAPKICNRWKARENLLKRASQPVQLTLGLSSAPDWLRRKGGFTLIGPLTFMIVFPYESTK